RGREGGRGDPGGVGAAGCRPRGGRFPPGGGCPPALPADRAARPLGAAPAARRRAARLGARGEARKRPGPGSARRPPGGAGIDVVSNAAMERLHPTGPHPETPERQRVLLESLKGWKESGPASEDDVARCHDPAYVERIRDISGPTWLDPDTVASETSYEGALLSAGAAIEAGRREALAIGRPPRHHALPTPSIGLFPVG